MIKRFLKWIYKAAPLLGVLAVGISLHYYFFLQNPLRVGKSGYILTIAPGSSVRSIAEKLSHDSVVEVALWFMLTVRMEGVWSELKAGEYLIKAGTLPKELIQQLKSGRVIQHALTIVPGWTFERLMMEINQCSALKHTLLDTAPAEIMGKLGFAGEHPEGQFFPETYYFTAGTADYIFLQRAHHLLQKKLQSAWDQKTPALPLKSPYEVLILASIIEKESSHPEEYADISGVFLRRLAKKMPLQADPTVIYGIGNQYKGIITSEMLTRSTPYNTYQKLGLPPTPIALPGEKALLAATRPNTGEYLYFVARKEGKGHVFSKTLPEHQKAVNEYRDRAAIGKP